MHFLTLEEQRTQESLIGFTGTSEAMDGPKTKLDAGIAVTRDGRQAFATVFLEPGGDFKTRKAIYCLIFPDKSLWMGRGLVGMSADFERAVSSSAEFRKQQACVLSRVS